MGAYSATCTHGSVEEVLTYGDKVIAGRCRTCTQVLWTVGKCDGCGKDERHLTFVVAGRGSGRARTFCNDECHRVAQREKRKAEAEAAAGAVAVKVVAK